MPFTPVRDIELIEVGSLGKETLSNDSFTNLSLGISGAAIIPLAGADVTLTEGTNGQAQHFVLILVGTLTANVNVLVPAESRVYVADNRTTGAFTVTFRPAAGGGVAVDQSARTLIYCDGSNVYPVASGTGGGGGATFLALTDTPDTYTGQAGKVVQVNAGATATEYGPVLGSMAQQDANAVAITGGSATFTGAVSVQEAITAAGGVYKPNTAGDNQYMLYSELNAAGGTNRRAIVCNGDASSYLGGALQVAGSIGIGIAPTGHPLWIQYTPPGVYGLVLQQSADSGATPVIFLNAAAATVGSITTTASATAYNTSSDVRLKACIETLVGALDVVRALRPVNFTWQSTGERDRGFLAHELQQHVPTAVTGEPDEVNPDGTIRPQQVDNSKLIPMLTAAVKELLARVETLEAQLA